LRRPFNHPPTSADEGHLLSAYHHERRQSSQARSDLREHRRRLREHMGPRPRPSPRCYDAWRADFHGRTGTPTTRVPSGHRTLIRGDGGHLPLPSKRSGTGSPPASLRLPPRGGRLLRCSTPTAPPLRLEPAKPGRPPSPPPALDVRERSSMRPRGVHWSSQVKEYIIAWRRHLLPRCSCGSCASPRSALPLLRLAGRRSALDRQRLSTTRRPSRRWHNGPVWQSHTAYCRHQRPRP